MTMRINPDDPRLTAYIMGELEDEARAALERELAECAESRDFVEQLRGTAELMRAGLSREAAASVLSTEQPRAPKQAQQAAAVEARGDAGRGVPSRRRPQAGALESEAAGHHTKVVRPVRWWKKRRVVVPLLASSAAMFALVGFLVSRIYSGRVMYNRAIDEPVLSGEKGPDEASGSLRVRSEPAGARVIVDGEPVTERSGTGERYGKVQDNPFRLVSRHPLSTFSIDVDTASYANVRRFLNQRTLPPRDAVRVEEMVNYFSYDYPPPKGRHPFSVRVDQARCPWNPAHRLVRIGLKGRELEKSLPSNLVFLIDVSGSMRDARKLPLLRRAMDLLVRQLGENDRVAIVVYAGASGLVLPSTACTAKNKPRIRSALERLTSGGSTNGAEGIELAYNVAVQGMVRGGVNRVILATDGDFNVGPTSKDALVKLIERKAKSGVFLSVLGFGMGNLEDATLEQLADKGNGNYAYIDTLREARKVLVQQMSGTLVTIAKDVKIQVELNPLHAAAYRLVGYENRLLADRDFDDDKKDAGEIGAGHTVTALYELVPPGERVPGLQPGLRYQLPPATPSGRGAGELLLVRLRYKQPDGARSRLHEVPVLARPERPVEAAPVDFKLAAAVAWFGMELRGSPHRGKLESPMGRILRLARQGVGQDPHGYRRELLALIRKAAKLKGQDVEREPVDPPPHRPSRASALLSKARESWYAGKDRLAVKQARAVLKLSPKNPEALQIVGAASCALKDRRGALWAYERLPEAQRDFLSDACLRQGMRISSPSRDWRMLLKLARQSYIAGEHALAIKQAREVLKRAPDNTDAIQIIGAASCYRKQADQARWAYRRLRPASRALIRNICMRNGISLSMRNVPRRRVRANPLENAALAKKKLRRARQSYIAGEHALAITQAREVLKLSPGNTDAIQIIAAASCYRKQVAQAKWGYRRLRPASRALVRSICARNGIDLE
jgi:Ca-activated chloride channel family protein